MRRKRKKSKSLEVPSKSQSKKRHQVRYKSTKGKTFQCIGGSFFNNVFVLHLRLNAHGKEEGKKVIAKMVYVGGQLYADLSVRFHGL